jgi:signal peptidase I
VTPGLDDSAPLPRARGLGAFLRDNLEAFAVAIAMALVIRHYCIEAFRIPTGSMMPTLYGDERPRHGDRILVDKFAYLRGDPERYQVAVFQYPLNRNQNYIKRIAGLPGEWLRIADGDIWVSRDEGATWELTRKPPGVREQLFFPYYPVPVDAREGFGRRTCWTGDDGWTIDEPSRRFSVDAGATPQEMRFVRQVVPYPEVDGGEIRVGDVRVRFRAEVERAGRIEVRIAELGREHVLALGAGGSSAVVGGAPPVPLDVDLPAGRETEVSFANVDDTLVVVVDGETREIPFPDTPSSPPEPTQGVSSISILATDVRAVLTDLSIDRDIYYLGVPLSRRSHSRADGWSDVWKIPEGRFLMLGDNTLTSSDSREWNVARVKLRDGTTIEWDPDNREARNPSPHQDVDGVVTIQADIDGLVRRYRVEDIDGTPENGLRRPYVTRDHLVGRAFAVFWPIYVPPLYKGATRVKIIR